MTMNCDKMYKIILTYSFFCCFAVCLRATDAQQVFQEANQAYVSGNYNLAIEKYEAILKESAVSKELYYNLGNSYFRLNKMGKAILNYERAMRLAPSDKDIQHNLDFTRGRIVNDIEPISPFFLIQWWRDVRGLLSIDNWSFLTLLFLWVGVAGFVFLLLGKTRTQKKQGFIGGSILIPLSIVCFLLAKDTQNELTSSRFAIVLSNETSFRPSPDSAIQPTALLHEGIKVEVIDKLSHFVKVRLPNGEEGWLEDNTIESI